MFFEWNRLRPWRLRGPIKAKERFSGKFMDFTALGLAPHLIKAVEAAGFRTPTPIQEQAILAIIEGDQNIVGLAQTGTGKTAAYGLPLLQLVDFSKPRIQGLILCPTRELCIQISKDLACFSRYMDNVKIAAIYGGAGMEPQIRQIRKGSQIIVATPGRLLDLMERRIINLSNVTHLVLDEADEMLTMGFQEDLDKILLKTPEQKRTWLFSATMTEPVAKISHSYIKNPLEITIGRKNSSAGNISHFNYVVMEKDRYPALKRIIDYHPDIFSLVFCRTRRETQAVAESLIKDGYNAESLHGDLSQTQRDNVMRRFREKALQILVATDVAARGLDVDDITHVIHFNLPDEAGAYTHRSGRTARAGKSGNSLVLMNRRENRRLAHVEKVAGVRFEHRKVPGGRAICEKQLFDMVEKLVTAKINHEQIAPFLPPVYDTLKGLSKEDLIQHVISLQFNRFLDDYKDVEDINAQPPSRKSTGRKRLFKDSPERSFDIRRLFLNAGELDGIKKGAITRLVCDQSGVSSRQIGKIQIMREFSFLEVDSHVAAHIMKSMKGATLDGRKVSMGYAEKKSEKGNQSTKERKGRKPWMGENGKTSKRGQGFSSSRKRSRSRAKKQWAS